MDIVAADLTVAYNRSRVIDYATTPFFFEAIGIMITEPVEAQPLWKWTNPFDYTVWLVLLAATVIVSSILYLNQVFQCVYVGWRFTHINDCIWHVGTGLLSQGRFIRSSIQAPCLECLSFRSGLHACIVVGTDSSLVLVATVFGRHSGI